MQKNKMTQAIIDYGNKKYGNPLGYVILVKILSIISLQNKNNIPALSILTVAPSGHFKTQSSNEVVRLFQDKTNELGSDLTMNNLLGKDKEINDKTMIINDLTLLFASKRLQTKNRLCSGLAELISDGKYTYRDYKETTMIRAHTNIIGNITDTSFKENKNQQFIANTFIERLFSFFYEAPLDNQKLFNKERDKRIKIRFKLKIILRFAKVIIPKNYDEEITTLAESYMENTASKSYNRANDKVKAIIISNVLLNGRKKACKEDLEITKRLVNFSIDTESEYRRVLFLYKQNKNPKEIADKLRLSLKSVYSHLKKIRETKSQGDIYDN